MSNVLVEKNKLDVLATAISNKSGEPLKLTLDEMVEAVDGIDTSGGGITPSGNIDITQAGVTDVTEYATATVPTATADCGGSGAYSTESGVRKWKYTSTAYAEDAGWVNEGTFATKTSTYNAVPSGTTITPTTSAQTIGGTNYMMEGAVTVNAMPEASLGVPVNSIDKTSTELQIGKSFPNYTPGYLSGIGTLYTTLPLEDKTVTPSTTSQTVTPTSKAYYLNSVTVDAMPSGTAGTPTATKGTVSNHSVSVTPSVTNTTGYITGGTKSGTAVSVSASELVSGTLPITQNGTTDVTNYASVNVSVPSSGEDVPVFTLDISTNPPTPTCNKTFAECEAYISSNNTVAILDAPLASTTFSMVAYNYVASYMIVYAIYDSNGYPIADIGWTTGGEPSYSEPSVLHENLPTVPTSTSSGTLQTTIDASTSTRYLNIRRGYYQQDKYYTLSAMPTGTAGTPTATKGTVSNHSVSVTPSVTNTTGYITGSTKTGTAVTVSASELVSGSETKTENGTYDVTNLASLVVALEFSTIYTGSGNPSSSTGTNGDIYLKVVN